jgi:biotin carboxyl carrier protein
MAIVKVESPVGGRVWRIEMAVGEQVVADDTIMILESMKMEIAIQAPAGGRLAEIAVKEEEVVQEGQVIATIET